MAGCCKQAVKEYDYIDPQDWTLTDEQYAELLQKLQPLIDELSKGNKSCCDH